MKRTTVFVTIPQSKIEIVTVPLPVLFMGTPSHVQPSTQKIIIDGIPDQYIELVSLLVDSIYIRNFDRNVQLKINIRQFIQYRVNNGWNLSVDEQMSDLIDFFHYKYHVSCQLDEYDYVFVNR